LEFRHLLRVLSAHRRTIVLLCLSATVNAVALTYLISEKYEAASLVLIRPQKDVKFSAEDKAVFDFPINFAIPFETISRTYGEVIRSRTIVEKVVLALGLDKLVGEESRDKPFRNLIRLTGRAWTLLKYGRIEAGSPLEDAIQTVAACLSVTPTKETFVFEIRCRTAKREQSAAIANAAAAAFVDYSREANGSESKREREFIAGRLEDSSREFEAAREQLKEFKDRQRTVLLDEELTGRIREAARLEAALADNGKEIDGVKAEIAEFARELGQQGQYLRSSSTVADNPVVVDLRKELSKLQVERSALLANLTAFNPQVVVLDERIAEIEGQLGKGEARVVSEETSSLNAVYQELDQKSLLDQANLQKLQAERENLLATLAARRAALATTADIQSEQVKLQLALDTTEETYRLVKRRYDEARIRELENVSDIRVVSPAARPTYPSGPIKIYQAGVSLFLAVLLGLLAALMLDYFSQRLLTVADAEKALGLPVLTAIPSLPGRS
jgi:uncharacterized protein involved in exopolysaccharide biosynthesis